MNISDPVSDLLARLRNALSARHEKADVPSSRVKVKGPKGSVVTPILAGVSVEKKDGFLNLVRGGEEKKDKALHGLNRALLQNAVLGVTDGFKREIDLVGIGFKAEVKGKNVVFSVGFSHQVTFPMPDGIKVDVKPDAKAKDCLLYTSPSPRDRQKSR